MNEQEKQLLLKDLCARLPYGVICKGICRDLDVIKDEYMDNEVCGPLTNIGYGYGILGLTKECKLSTIKPYLRPMSSMTEEELYEWTHTWIMDTTFEKYDWLNEHHFDYRGLIEKGIAFEAPEGMYNTKTE